MGPLVTRGAVSDMQAGLKTIRQQGGEVIYGGEVLEGPEYAGGCWVKPCIVKAKRDLPIVQEEIFAPILYLIEGRRRERGVRRAQRRSAGAVVARCSR